MPIRAASREAASQWPDRLRRDTTRIRQRPRRLARGGGQRQILAQVAHEEAKALAGLRR